MFSIVRLLRANQKVEEVLAYNKYLILADAFLLPNFSSFWGPFLWTSVSLPVAINSHNSLNLHTKSVLGKSALAKETFKSRNQALIHENLNNPGKSEEVFPGFIGVLTFSFVRLIFSFVESYSGKDAFLEYKKCQSTLLSFFLRSWE